MLPISVLDLAPIVTGGDAARALRNSLDLAQHAERWGYRRYWLAEHHNMPGIASAATSVVIGYVASGTATIRVGSGGVMLPNHAPLVIAEQFGTLRALYGDRIDLGVGRAPGTDPLTAFALRRNLDSRPDGFADDVVELLGYFRAPSAEQKVRAVPGAGLGVPLWLLGSSLYSAQLAAALGLPFSFASHFAPDHLLEALALYRNGFRPSASLARATVMPALAVYAAETDREAERLFTSLQQAFIQLRRGTPGPLPPPVDSMDGRWSPAEKMMLEHTFSLALVGSKERVRRGLQDFIARTRPDEIMVTAGIFDHTARLRSFEIVAEIAREM